MAFQIGGYYQRYVDRSTVHKNYRSLPIPPAYRLYVSTGVLTTCLLSLSLYTHTHTNNRTLYSWSMPWVGNAAEADLSNVSGYSLVILSFMQPDTTYAAGTGPSLEGTGLQFSSEPQVIKESIATLKSKNPDVKVLVAVGGATFHNWEDLNPQGIASFVSEFGLDGVDIDFEPPLGPDGTLNLSTDELYANVTRALRDSLPRPLLLTSAVWSVGAYGQGAFAEASPQGSPYAGFSARMLQGVGDLLDQIHVMAYDAGDDYNPCVAYDAYRSVYSGPIVMGIEVPPDAVGGHSTSLEEVRALAEHVRGQGGAGVFVWSIQKEGTPGVGVGDIIQTARQVFGI